MGSIRDLKGWKEEPHKIELRDLIKYLVKVFHDYNLNEEELNIIEERIKKGIYEIRDVLNE